MNRTLEPVCKDHLASPDVTESMGIMGYQAATDEMELKVKGAWRVPLGHVVRREKWDQVEQTLITGTGNNARGRTTDQGKMILKSAPSTAPVNFGFVRSYE